MFLEANSSFSKSKASLSLCDKGAQHSWKGWVVLLFGRFLHLRSFLFSCHTSLILPEIYFQLFISCDINASSSILFAFSLSPWSQCQNNQSRSLLIFFLTTITSFTRITRIVRFTSCLRLTSFTMFTRFISFHGSQGFHPCYIHNFLQIF